MSQRKANISIPFRIFIKCSLTKNTYWSGRIGIHAKRNLWKLTLSKKTWQIKSTKSIGNQCQKNFFCDMYDVVYLSSTNKFKNTDKAIFNTLPNTNLLTRQSSFISFIGHTVCLVKKSFFSFRIQLCKGKRNVFTLFFCCCCAKKEINFRFCKPIRHSKTYLKVAHCSARKIQFCEETYCIGYVAAITQSKKDSQ